MQISGKHYWSYLKDGIPQLNSWVKKEYPEEDF
jgi:hypothetical protein